MSFLSFLLPSLVSAGSSIATGLLGNSAASTQADASLKATQDANALQKYIYDNNTRLSAPWLQQGSSAVNRLGWLLGLPGAQPPAAAPQGSSAPAGNGGYQGGGYYPNYGGFDGFTGLNGFGSGYTPSSGGTGGGNPVHGGGQFGQNGSSGYGYPGQLLPPDPNNPYDQFSQDSYGPNGFLPPVSSGGNGNIGGLDWLSGLGGGLGDGNPLGTALGTGGSGGVVLPESIGGGSGEVGGFTGEGTGGDEFDGGRAQREGASPMMAATSLNDGEGGGDNPPPMPRELTPAAPVAGDPSQPTVPDNSATPNSPNATTPAAYGSADSPYGTASEFGSLAKNFGLSDFQTDPGYQFRLSEGRKALEHSAAARGTTFSGATLKALDRYNQDFSSNEFTNAYNRYQLNKTTNYNQLAGLAGLGQQSAQTLTNAGTNYANQSGQNTIAGLTGAANARASGYGATANAINGSASNLQNLLLLKQLGLG
jgi:hypothetical protein